MASSVLCLCVAVVLCGVVSSFPEPSRCDSNCAFQEQIWDVTRFSQEYVVPEGLANTPFDDFGLDGSSTWYEGCLYPVVGRLEEFGDYNLLDILERFKQMTLANCVACRPGFVYLYDNQFRLFPSNGLVGDYTYISGGYQPSVADWTAYCSSDSDVALPNNSSALVEELQGADNSGAFAPACYSIVSCTYTQTIHPLQAARTCTPGFYNGTWPSQEYCSWVYGFQRFNFAVNGGCNQGGCESLKFFAEDSDILSSRSRFSQMAPRALSNRRHSRQSDSDSSDIQCLAAVDFFFSR
jgi:hypothetical protein